MDKNHIVAKQLDGQLRTRQPTCCRHAATLWDLVALYPKGTKWGAAEPIYVDGPVAKVKEDLERESSTLLR